MLPAETLVHRRLLRPVSCECERDRCGNSRLLFGVPCLILFSCGWQLSALAGVAAWRLCCLVFLPLQLQLL